VKSKICQNCWYYAPAPVNNKFLEDNVPHECYPYCELNHELSAITSGKTCEDWESKKLKLINVIKILYGV
jgi:hypothetical protein